MDWPPFGFGFNHAGENQTANNVKVPCLAEAFFGAGRGLNPVFYISLGNGGGGRLACQNRVYHGDIPCETEVGHLRLNRNGLTLEQSCSGWTVNQKNPNLRTGKSAWPTSFSTFKTKRFLEILHSTVTDLAFGLSHVVHLQHPQTISSAASCLSLANHCAVQWSKPFLNTS